MLFLVSDFAPQPSVGRIRTQKMCKFLPEFGWRTSVLTIEPPPGSYLDPALLAEVPAGAAVYRVPCPQPFEAPVRWASRWVRGLPGPVSQGAGNEPRTSVRAEANGGVLDRASRGVDWVKRGLTRHVMIPDEAVTAIPSFVRAAVDLIRGEGVDVLVSSVPGFSPWLAAVLAGQRTGTPVVVDYRDLWHRDVLRTWIGPLRRRFELGLERWALRRTAAVVGASQGKTEFVRAIDPTAAGKPYVTIYNGFDADDCRGLCPKRLPGDAGRLVLLYTGRLYGHRRIDPLIESLGRVTAAGRIPRDRLRLRILGTVAADQQQRVARIIERFGLHDVVETRGYVTRIEALAQQLGADAVVLIVDPGETSAGVLPGKITEYLGMGRFVLAVCPRGEAQRLLDRYGRAAWASADEPGRLDAAVVELYGRWRADPRFAEARRASDVVPSRRENAAALAEILDRLVHAPDEPRTSVRAGARAVPPATPAELAIRAACPAR